MLTLYTLLIKSLRSAGYQLSDATLDRHSKLAGGFGHVLDKIYSTAVSQSEISKTIKSKFPFVLVRPPGFPRSLSRDFLPILCFQTHPPKFPSKFRLALEISS